MLKFIINGGKPLNGAVRLGGAKNASFKLMIGAMLGNDQSRLLNLSHIGDVDVTKKTMIHLGLKVENCGERTIIITPKKNIDSTIPQFSGEKSRASTLFASVLLSMTGKAIIPQPGGCVLGTRPVDRHIEGLEAMGVGVTYKDKYIFMQCDKLKGTKYRFTKKTHTGTEALILAAVKACGQTILENAGLEPEIDDLINFLNQMGAKIRRDIGDQIIIDGVENLKGAVYQIMPDRNEAVSYAVAALATKGDIVVENARKQDLAAFLEKIDNIGGHYEVANYGIRFWYENPLKATNILTRPHPGFMTDWQPLWAILMTQSQGTSEIIEAVHNNRFQYVDKLNQMGAKINFFEPANVDKQTYYEFDYSSEDDRISHGIKIFGPTPLSAINAEIPDLRAGATLVIAALIADGQSSLTNIEHIDRGYEFLDQRLNQLGADIRRAS